MQVYILEKWAWHQNQSDICSTALLRQTIQAPLTVPSKNTAPLKKTKGAEGGGREGKSKTERNKKYGWSLLVEKKKKKKSIQKSIATSIRISAYLNSKWDTMRLLQAITQANRQTHLKHFANMVLMQGKLKKKKSRILSNSTTDMKAVTRCKTEQLH